MSDASADPCPTCGEPLAAAGPDRRACANGHKVIGVTLTGKVSTSGRLVAEHQRPHEVVAEDSARFGERSVVDKVITTIRKTIGFRVSDSSVPFTAAADDDGAGNVRVVLDGEPQEHEEGATFAAQHVLERLNAGGGTWQVVSVTGADARAERGIDVVARDANGATLPMQVTRAERVLWRALARTGRVDSVVSIDTIADALWTAIGAKRRTADPEVALVLDAANTPQFALDAVMHRFRDRHAQISGRVGYREIWLAGPTSEKTFRLA
jgi:hypothetical protein